MNPKFRWIAAFVTAVSLMHGCGGGGGGAQSGGIGGTGVVSKGVMTKGSVILNGVRFTDTSATIVIDDRPRSAAYLQSGMVVQVKGNLSDSGGGTAERVEAQVEVRGMVSTKDSAANPQTFVIFQQTVIVDDQTIYSNLPSFASIVAGTTVLEIHGLRDAAGNIRATRIEKSQTPVNVSPTSITGMTNPTEDEIRGVATAFTSLPGTFLIGGQVVRVDDPNAVTPNGASIINNVSIVEVHCIRQSPTVSGCLNLSNEFVASRVDVEDAEDEAFAPTLNSRLEVDGLVSEYAGVGDLNFMIDGVPVTISAGTIIEGGVLADDMADNVRIEAEGIWTGSTLEANKIEFKRTVVRVQGDPGVPTSGNTFPLAIGLIGSVTVELPDSLIASLPTGAEPCIQVRGVRKSASGGGVIIIADEIGNCGSSEPFIQAPVEVETGTTLTMLGFPINVGSPTDPTPYKNTDGSPMSSTAFFTAVVPASPGPPAVAGTLVKVRFEMPSGLVKQAELED